MNLSNNYPSKKSTTIILILIIILSAISQISGQVQIFNIADFLKSNDDQVVIQKAIDSCATTGGGIVYMPPGEYTSGTIYLKNNVRFFLEAGATLKASRDVKSFSKRALIYGENLENITIEGEGVIDGCAEYEWRDDDVSGRLADGVPSDFEPTAQRPYPFLPAPKMIVLVNCQDVKIRDISIINSPAWTIHPWGCEGVKIDGITIGNNLREGAWTDGINPDCCTDVQISNCTVTAGDDGIAIKTTNQFGTPKPCQNIMITNCRLSSASCGIKIGTETLADIHHVVVSNCIIRNSNRGIGIIVRDSALVSNVLYSNLNIDCVRHDYYWWGNGDPFFFVSWNRPGVTNPGTIKNVMIENVIAHGKGSSYIEALSGNAIEGFTISDVKLFLSADEQLDFPNSERQFSYEHFYHTKLFPATGDSVRQLSLYGLKFNNVKNVKLMNMEIIWENDIAAKWEHALYCENIDGLKIEKFSGRQPQLSDEKNSAIFLNNVSAASIRESDAQPGTGTFIQISGDKSGSILLSGNDFSDAKNPVIIDNGVPQSAVTKTGNIFSK